jgi:hypothetical protein
MTLMWPLFPGRLFLFTILVAVGEDYNPATQATGAEPGPRGRTARVRTVAGLVDRTLDRRKDC